MINIVHITCGMGGGRGAMVRELYYAFNKYYGEEVQQRIYVNEKTKSVAQTTKDKKYGLKFHQMHMDSIYNEIKDLSNLVIIDHKTSKSDTQYFKKFRKNNIPVICICHTHSPAPVNSVITQCDYIIPVANSLMEYLPSNNKWMNNNNTVVINNSVNEDLYAPISPIERSDKEKQMLITGRINAGTQRKYRKDWAPFWQSARLKKKMIHEYMGKVCVKQKVCEGVNTIRYLGFIGDFNQKVSILKSWDCFLYGIKGKEGVSMAIVEALACGIPCIISNSPGNIEVITSGVNGFIFNELSDAERIINNEILKDEKAIVQLRDSTRKHFYENMRAELWIKKYMDIIKEFYNG